jgi:hypothetical protein
MPDYASGRETRATALRVFAKRQIDPGQSQAADSGPNTVSTSRVEAF